MRIWSIHPKYLDSKGLVALWREALLAQHVLLGKTKGYTNHPQLERFKAQREPVAAIGAYLLAVHEEATARNFRFDAGKIVEPGRIAPIPVTDAQLAFEMAHLQRKLKTRDPLKYKEIIDIKAPAPHPLFTMVKGAVESWERV